GGWREVDREVATRLLAGLVPHLEDYANMSIEALSLKIGTPSTHGSISRARLEGAVKIKHLAYYDRSSSSMADSTVVGYLDYDSAKKKITSFGLATEKATYGKSSFGAVMCSV